MLRLLAPDRFEPEFSFCFVGADSILLGATAATFFCIRRLAQSPAVWSLRFRRNLFTLKTGRSILLAVPVYHRVYSPGELQFITAEISQEAGFHAQQSSGARDGTSPPGNGRGQAGLLLSVG